MKCVFLLKRWLNIVLSLICLLSGPGAIASEILKLLEQTEPVPALTETRDLRSVGMCGGSNGCSNCNVDLKVGHYVFVHGYSSDTGAFSFFANSLEPQNSCAGYTIYRPSIGQEAKRDGANNVVEITCDAGQYNGRCIGHCSQRDSQGNCRSYDRSKNGICEQASRCVTFNENDGARKYLSTWSEDLSSFFQNVGLNDLPDRSVTVYTHSTGGPAVADMMVKGYHNSPHYARSARKVKEVITVQAALGGACGASALGFYDDAVSDLAALADGRIRLDFRLATFDGSVPWTHVQSKGETGLFGEECEGKSYWGVSTGSVCSGTTHDGLVQNWSHSTSVRHPNGAGNNAGNYPYSIKVTPVESPFCHFAGDDFDSYRSVPSRFRLLFETAARPIDEVRNPAQWQPWWPVVLNPF